MIDGRHVLDTVREGKVPPGWQVLHMRYAAFLAQARSRFVLGIFAGVAWLILFVIFIVVDLHSRPAYVLLGLIWLLVWGVTTIASVAAGFRFQNVARRGTQEVFVLTPQGCFEGDTASLIPIHEVIYSQTAHITLVRSRLLGLGTGRASLRIQPRAGAAWTWRLDDRFLPSHELAVRILLDFTRQSEEQPVTFNGRELP